VLCKDNGDGAGEFIDIMMSYFVVKCDKKLGENVTFWRFGDARGGAKSVERRTRSGERGAKSVRRDGNVELGDEWGWFS
jgi:hypothetical protein